MAKAEGAGAKITASADLAGKVTKPLNNFNNYNNFNKGFGNQSGLSSKDKDFKSQP